MKRLKTMLDDTQFKGTSNSSKSLLEASFQEDFEAFKGAYEESPQLQKCFSSLGLTFPERESQVANFLDEVDDSTATKILAVISKIEVE